ncbi:hypothetical protein F5050DRAFT_1802229 [Lentinula boryana]|uniref:CxC1-like cysteine cluster associated with KDZ transposases domain-containing protein n=1 Tax=Lentinula boryana TaxID=40481 RepID=A0ABQ8PXD0_9AGAR|nr:hypothetical protein F5050DRAFT_1802229 [Lentinula boryana]
MLTWRLMSRANILPSSESLQHLYSELYNSDAFIEEHDHIQCLPAPPDQPSCKLERVALGLMFWSDSTHLANFGEAKLWPLYMMFGNLLKYICSRPNSGACQHIPYIPLVNCHYFCYLTPFHDFASCFFTKWSTTKQCEGLLTHCQQELMHAVWKFLLNDEFLHAYKYGVVIQCHDGVEHRFFPRIFTYSADYPEKVLIATIRDKGKCSCPRCAVTRARTFIYHSGLPINGTAVNSLLKDISSIPTINAFDNHLRNNFSVSKMLAVDLLHEIELGVWCTLWTHLIQMLYAAPRGPKLVAELDRR